MMRPALLAGVVLALLSGAAAPRSGATLAEPMRASKAPSPVLGIAFHGHEPRGALAWFDPLTLRKLPGRNAPLGVHLASWALSADRAVFASASCRGDAAEPAAIRFVNARAMRVLGDLRLTPYEGCADSLTWIRPDRLLAVVRRTGQPSEIAVVDPIARRVLRREPLPSPPWATGRTPHELVVMLSTYGSFAPTRVAVIGADGTVRLATAERVVSGMVVDEDSDDHRARAMLPGLAVDPDGRRAFLLPASGPVAEVDLQTLAVSYHEVERPSLLERFFEWLVSEAEAKSMEGSVREARWLGDGMIGVSGMDHSIVQGAQGNVVQRGTPAGLTLLDTRSWTSRIVSAEASSFAATPGIVVAHGGSWDPAVKRLRGPGVVAFGLDGRERWKLHPGEYGWIVPAGPLGYVQVTEGRREVVELATGRVLKRLRRDERNNPWPRLLAAQASDW